MVTLHRDASGPTSKEELIYYAHKINDLEPEGLQSSQGSYGAGGLPPGPPGNTAAAAVHQPSESVVTRGEDEEAGAGP